MGMRSRRKYVLVACGFSLPELRKVFHDVGELETMSISAVRQT